MKCAHSDLINTTFSSHRNNLVGHFYFDCVKKAWFEIVESEFVYTAFEFAFGARWPTNHHRITKTIKCSVAKSKHLETCSKQEFSSLKA